MHGIIIMLLFSSMYKKTLKDLFQKNGMLLDATWTVMDMMMDIIF